MTERIVSVLALVAAVILCAGCTYGPATPPVPSVTATAMPAPATIATPGPNASASPTPIPVINGTTLPVSLTPLPATVLPATGYRRFQDTDYSLEYPASWQTNETTQILPEFVHTIHGCMVTSYYQTYQHLRFFTSLDGNALIYTSVVDTETDVWPRDINGEIVYADIVNTVLGDPTHCANTPAGAFTISSVTRTQVPGVSYPVARVDFGKINSLGYADGAGTLFVVTGNHKHGVFAFYVANSTGGVWNTAAEHMFNTLQLNPYF